MATFFEVQKAALKQMKRAAEIAEELEFDIVAASIREKMEEMAKRVLMVVVAGEVKRGKSALLNALLNETEPVCPVDADVCTNVVTVLRYGKRECINVYITDDKAEDGVRVENIERWQISDYVSEGKNPNNYKNVFQIEVQLPNELLKEGVVFVDTPGVGSLNVEHTETTFAFLPNADMLLFVTDTLSVITDTELKFLERGYQYCDCVVYPFTKMDLRADYEVTLNSNKEKISSILHIQKDDVQMIPVSSKIKQKYLKNTEREIYYKNSNYAILEETIWTAIAERQAAVRILPYLTETQNQLRLLWDSLAGQYEALENSEVAKKLEKDLEKREEEIRKLQQSGADWRNSIQIYFSERGREMEKIQDRVCKEAETLLETRSNELKTKLCKEENYRKLLGEINDILITGIMECRTTLECGLEKKVDSVRKELGLDISTNQQSLERMKYTTNEELKVCFPPKKLISRVIDNGMKISESSMSIGKIGESAGSVIGSLWGLWHGNSVLGKEVGSEVGKKAGVVAGAIVGVVKVCRNKFDINDLQAVENALMQQINSAREHMDGMVEFAEGELKQTVINKFAKKLKEQMEMLKKNRKAIQEGISSEKEENLKKQKEIKQKIDKVRSVFDMISLQQTAIGELQLQRIKK